MNDNLTVHVLNRIYEEEGFDGVISFVEDTLGYGTVKEMGKGLYRISTGGYSDDEDLLHNLIRIDSRFGYYHYVGYLRGGAFYFSTDKHDDTISITKGSEIDGDMFFLTVVSRADNGKFLDIEADEEVTREEAVDIVKEMWNDKPSDYYSWNVEKVIFKDAR